MEELLLRVGPVVCIHLLEFRPVTSKPTIPRQDKSQSQAGCFFSLIIIINILLFKLTN